MWLKLKAGIYRLLRWGEKYTKTDNVYLAKGGSWLAVGQVISLASTFVLSIFFANILPKDIYGGYKYVLTLASIFSLCSLPGMNGAITQAVVRGYEGSVSLALRARLKFGLGGSLLAVATGLYYLWLKNYELAGALLVISPLIPLFDAFSLSDALLMGRKDFYHSTIYYSLSNILTTIVIALTVLTKSLWVLVLGYFASWALVRLIFYLRTIAQQPPNDLVDPTAVNYGQHLSFLKASSTIVGNLSFILIFHLLGSASLAIYSFALAPLEQIRGVISYVDSLLAPKLSRTEWQAKNNQSFQRQLLLFLLIITLLVIIYIGIAPFFYQIFFPQYRDSILYSQVLALTLVPTALFIVQNSILRAKRSIRGQYVLNILDLVLTLTLTPSLLYFYQIWGLIAGLAISRLIEVVVAHYFIYQTRIT